MGSSRPPDRSLGSGLSLPQWMKGKMDTKLDFDDTAFSPPSHDDSFFYIRYPKQQEPSTPAAPQGFRAISEVLHENTMTMTSNKPNDKSKVTATTSELKKANEIDFSKHPLPCQPFIPTANNQVNEIKPPKTVVAGKMKLKSQGTDDGFHSEPALCGKSIVHVANQMMSNNKLTRSSNNGTSESTMMKIEMEPKKGSKSLPVTPIASPSNSPDSSPKARRRLHTNRYFTGTFVPDRDKYQSGWILASILGHSREIVSAKIDEEDESIVEIPSPPPHRVLSRKKSISSQNLTYIGKDDDNKPSETSLIQTTNVFKAKPSELREMNFWSPTSM